MTIAAGVARAKVMCGEFGITIDFGIVGLRNVRKFARNENEAVWAGVAGADGVGVVAGVVGVVAGALGMLVDAVGMLVGIVGMLVGMLVGMVVGMVVGVVGMMVGIMNGIVGIGVMTGGGFIGADMVLIDRRARPSSGSTESDAILLVLRPAARWWFCSWYAFIGFFS